MKITDINCVTKEFVEVFNKAEIGSKLEFLESMIDVVLLDLINSRSWNSLAIKSFLLICEILDLKETDKQAKNTHLPHPILLFKMTVHIRNLNNVAETIKLEPLTPQSRNAWEISKTIKVKEHEIREHMIKYLKYVNSELHDIKRKVLIKTEVINGIEWNYYNSFTIDLIGDIDVNKEMSISEQLDKIFYSNKISEQRKIILIFNILDKLDDTRCHDGMWSVEDVQFLIQLSNSLEAVKKEHMYDNRKTPLSAVMLEKALTVRTFTAIGKLYGVTTSTVSSRLHRYIRLLYSLFRYKLNETQSDKVCKLVSSRPIKLKGD